MKRSLIPTFKRSSFPRLRAWTTAFLLPSFFILLPTGSVHAQPVIETVFFDMPENLEPNPIPAPTQQLLNVPGYPDNPNQLTFIARLYLPDPAVHGNGPYPTVLMLHGSGGMWSNDIIPNPITSGNSPVSQFRNWGDLLVVDGYACLIPDSFNPRGIPGDFRNKYPTYNPAFDDALCSPNYERPKDVVASLTYIVSHPNLDHDNIALIGFSHGAQTGMNALLDSSVDLGNYTVDYLALVDNGMGGQIEDEIDLDVPSPVRIPPHLPIPKFCAFYYGGGGHFGYHGSSSSTAAGRYMLDRRTKAILFHGSDDYLMGLIDHDVDPRPGSLRPIKQVLASAAQAASLGITHSIRHHYIFDRCDYHTPDERVTHSFDLGSVTIAPQQDWDTVNESPNQKARRLARDEVLRWLDFSLGSAPEVTITRDPSPPHSFDIEWTSRTPMDYKLQKSPDGFATWPDVTNLTSGTGNLMAFEADDETSAFFRVIYQPKAAPINEQGNECFFLDYSDFDL